MAFLGMMPRTTPAQTLKAAKTEDTRDETNNSNDENVKDKMENRSHTVSTLSDDREELLSKQKEVQDIDPAITTKNCPPSFTQQEPSIANPFIGQREIQLELAQECFDNGMSHWGEAKYDLALPLFLRSLEIREDILGKLHDDTGKSYLWVGSIHWHKSDHERALDNFCRCFRIRFTLYENKSKCGIVCTWIEKVLDAVGEDIPTYWNTLLASIEHERKGDVLNENRRFEYAIVEYQSALRCEFHRLGMTATTRSRSLVDVADIHYKIASAMMALGNYERSMMEYRHALHIYFDTFGLHQRSTNKNLQDISTVGEMLGFRKEMINNYMDVLYDAIYLEKSADLHFERTEYSAALQKYDRVLQYENQGMGHLQGYYGMICNKLAECHRLVGHTDEAMRFACTAFGIFNRILGSRNHQTLATMRMIQELAGRPRAGLNDQLRTFEV